MCIVFKVGASLREMVHFDVKVLVVGCNGGVELKGTRFVIVNGKKV